MFTLCKTAAKVTLSRKTALLRLYRNKQDDSYVTEVLVDYTLKPSSTFDLEVGEVGVSSFQSSLSGDSTESKHSETSVQNFSGGHALLYLGALVLQELKRVETKVSSLAVELSLGDLNEGGARAELDEANDHEQELHGALLNHDVVGIVGSGDVLDRVD